MLEASLPPSHDAEHVAADAEQEGIAGNVGKPRRRSSSARCRRRHGRAESLTALKLSRPTISTLALGPWRPEISSRYFFSAMNRFGRPVSVSWLARPEDLVLEALALRYSLL